MLKIKTIRPTSHYLKQNKNNVVKFKFLLYEICYFIFSYTSHKTAANPSPARLSTRWHLIRRPAAATFPSGEGSGVCGTTKERPSLFSETRKRRTMTSP